MNSLKALCFSKVWTSACQHLRFSAPLRVAGWELVLPSEHLEQDIQNCNLILVNRQFPVDEYETFQNLITLAGKHAKAVVYETDDLLIELPHEHPEWRLYSAHRFRYIEALLLADHVLVTNEELRTNLEKYNKNIIVMPNYLDESLWGLSEIQNRQAVNSNEKKTGTITIGYMGTVTHSSDLLSIEPVLVSLLNQYEGKVKLKLWGVPPVGRLKDHLYVEHEGNCPGEYELFVPYFKKQKADIFIAPLSENKFNSCKSFLKFLEYSSLAKPGVFSASGQYALVVKDNQTGFLASNLLEWHRKLSQLIEDEDLRQRLGQAAFADVQKHWVMAAHKDYISSVFTRSLKPSLNPPPKALVDLSKEASSWAEEFSRDEEKLLQINNPQHIAGSAKESEKLRRDMQKMMQRLLRLRAELSASQRHAAGLDNLVLNLTRSWAWRVGSAVTEPARNLRKAISKRSPKGIEIKKHG